MRSVPHDVVVTRGLCLRLCIIFARENAVKTPWRISNDTPAEYRSGVVRIIWQLLAHIDLQVINAPKLAQPQSLGLQAKDWEIL